MKLKEVLSKLNLKSNKDIPTSWKKIMKTVCLIEDLQDGEEGDGIRGHLYSVIIAGNNVRLINHTGDIGYIEVNYIDDKKIALREMIKCFLEQFDPID
jgi:peptide methionine sulfoxide reductase MsrA